MVGRHRTFGLACPALFHTTCTGCLPHRTAHLCLRATPTTLRLTGSTTPSWTGAHGTVGRYHRPVRLTRLFHLPPTFWFCRLGRQFAPRTPATTTTSGLRTMDAFGACPAAGGTPAPTTPRLPRSLHSAFTAEFGLPLNTCHPAYRLQRVLRLNWTPGRGEPHPNALVDVGLTRLDVAWFPTTPLFVDGPTTSIGSFSGTVLPTFRVPNSTDVRACRFSPLRFGDLEFFLHLWVRCRSFALTWTFIERDFDRSGTTAL